MSVHSIAEKQEQPEFNWNSIQDRLRDSVVAISSTKPLTFDTDSLGSFLGTGFVVDAERGLILSNRHVMSSGPSYHKAIFFNNVEVFLQPFYYDPMHDFSIFRYDPAELNSFTPNAIPLSPEKAYSGMEFRVVGNSAGEKMSVHPGELSQLDRNVPYYGDYEYSDYNTFYIQAPTTSNCGSSGSPVVNIEGHAIAIMAGGSGSTSANYFLPLYRAVYALEYAKRGEVPPRGTLQTVFTHITHLQAERLGLKRDEAINEGVQVDNTTGLLAVKKLLPNGPADGQLQIGDILISINGKPIPGFVEMEEVIDAAVNNNASLKVFSGSAFKTVSITVQDLFEITPSRILNIGGASLQDMSFQLSICNSLPITGVFIIKDSLGFFDDCMDSGHSVIVSVNGVDTPNLQALMGILQNIPISKPFVIKTRKLSGLHNKRVLKVRHPVVHPPNTVLTRSRATGFWSSAPYLTFSSDVKSNDLGEAAALSPSPSIICALLKGKLGAVRTAVLKGLAEKTAFGRQQLCSAISSVVRPDKSLDSNLADQMPNVLVRKQHKNDSMHIKSTKKVYNNIVNIRIQNITPADGSTAISASGSGLVVNKTHGIIICSRSLMENSTSNISVTFGGKTEIPAIQVYSHPLYPISFLKYDPTQLEAFSKDAKISTLRLGYSEGAGRLDLGAAAVIISQTSEGMTEVTPTTVSSRSLLKTNACNCCPIQTYSNIEMFNLSPRPCADTSSLGIICNARGVVCGMWVNIPECGGSDDPYVFVGLDIELIRRTLATLVARVPRDFDKISILNAEFELRSLVDAKALGVSDEHIQQTATSRSQESTSVIAVRKILKNSVSAKVSLEDGDVILKLNGRKIDHINEVACLINCESAELTIMRDLKELTLTIPTIQPPKVGTYHVVDWAGMCMQEPWLAAQQISRHVPSQVFVFCETAGSPMDSKLETSRYYVTEIDGTPIQTLDDVVCVIQRLKDPNLDNFNQAVANNKAFLSGTIPGRDVKIRVVVLNGEEKVLTIRTDDHHLPAYRIIRGRSINDMWKYEVL
ncbi:hypothetical protein LPJ66_005442 [Kickxella alabastrina]|uniref:Uncharacterized protein n=1 Tax=Kickxella alabastrina TaxID=61397 RepID=A0ACC1IER6_9FUNG|nr:hypothetical protein LPJ66_005442 [Kickxella alabastrina]